MGPVDQKMIGGRDFILCKSMLAIRSTTSDYDLSLQLPRLAKMYLNRKASKSRAVLAIQNQFRCFVENKVFQRKKRAATLIQCFTRRVKAKEEACKRKAAVNFIGRKISTNLHRRRFLALKTLLPPIQARLHQRHAKKSTAAIKIQSIARGYFTRHFLRFATSLSPPFQRNTYLAALQDSSLSLPQQQIIRHLCMGKLPFYPRFVQDLCKSTLQILSQATTGTLSKEKMEALSFDTTPFTREDFLAVANFLKRQLSQAVLFRDCNFSNVDPALNRLEAAEQLILENVDIATLFHHKASVNFSLKRSEDRNSPLVYPATLQWKSAGKTTADGYAAHLESLSARAKEDPTFDIMGHTFPGTRLDQYLLFLRTIAVSQQCKRFITTRVSLFNEDMKQGGIFPQVVKVIVKEIKRSSFESVRDRWPKEFGKRGKQTRLSRAILRIIGQGVPYHERLFHTILSESDSDIQNAEANNNLGKRSLREAYKAGYISSWSCLDPLTNTLLSLTESEIEGIKNLSEAEIQEFLLERIKDFPPNSEPGLYEAKLEDNAQVAYTMLIEMLKLTNDKFIRSICLMEECYNIMIRASNRISGLVHRSIFTTIVACGGTARLEEEDAAARQ